LATLTHRGKREYWRSDDRRPLHLFTVTRASSAFSREPN
jgi:hypothetical protein